MLKSSNLIIMENWRWNGPKLSNAKPLPKWDFCVWKNIISLYFFTYLNLLEIILDSNSSHNWDTFSIFISVVQG